MQRRFLRVRIRTTGLTARIRRQARNGPGTPTSEEESTDDDGSGGGASESTGGGGTGAGGNGAGGGAGGNTNSNEDEDGDDSTDDQTDALLAALTSGGTTTPAPVTNSAPVLDLDANDSNTVDGVFLAPAAFDENVGTGVAVVGTDLDITDPDAINGPVSIVSATVTITNLLNGTDEVLSVTPSGSISLADIDTSTPGQLIITQSASHGLYEAVLSTLTYTNTATNPFLDDRVIEISVNDGAFDSTVVTAVVSLTGNNDAPVIAGIAGDPALAYTEDDGARVIDTGVAASISDSDTSSFDGGILSVMIAGGTPAEDELAIRNQGSGTGQIGVSGSTVSYAGIAIGTSTGNGAAGSPLTIELNADADAAAVSALTGNITYENTNTGNPDVSVRTVTFSFDDGDGGATSSDSQVTTINLTAVNDAPSVAGQVFAGTENASVGDAVGTVSASDAEGDTLTYSIIGGNTDGAFSIDSSTGAISVANTSALDLLLGVSASDAEGDTLTYSIIGGNTDGAFSIDSSTGAISVANTSALDFETTPTFGLNVQVQDDGAPTGTTTATVTINLSDLNEAPSSPADQSVSLAENTANTTEFHTVLATDVDAGESLTYSITAGNAGGEFAINAATGAISVANAAALDFEAGTTTFGLTVQVEDSGGLTLRRSVLMG